MGTRVRAPATPYFALDPSDSLAVPSGLLKRLRDSPEFVVCDREQSFLMPPDVREWPPEDHFAWFVLNAAEALD